MSDSKSSKKDIRGTRTERAIVAAYLSECQAYARYTFYARQAEKENYFPIQIVFQETAANELNHAKVFFKMLQGGKVEAPLNADSGIIGTTAENLAISIEEELNEGIKQYRADAAVAREEGFDEIASHFEAIADVEQTHHDRFQRYLDRVKAGTVWHRDHPIKWHCLVCGYVYEGVEPPQVCPGCDHPYQHYMPLYLVDE